MRGLLAALILLLALAVPHLVGADGEPIARLSETGIIVPISEDHAYVLNQQVTVRLPDPKRVSEDPAVVRAEYVLESGSREPLDLWIGWPTTGVRSRGDRPARECLPFIKLHGKPVGYNFLTFDDLADQYVKPWMERIDELLASKPALREQVLRIRDEGTKHGKGWLASEGMSALARWMMGEGALIGNATDPRRLAGGLLGVVPAASGDPRDEFVQHALTWLDPEHERVDVHELLSHRWGHDTRLLDPESGHLVDTRSEAVGYIPTFAVFRFPIRLEHLRQHRLVVQYGQFLGGAAREPGTWYGMVYLMEPARRWGRWDKTTIEIKAPAGWKTVAIRPPAKKVATEGGVTTYRIVMPRRPCENLYVSVK